MFSNNDPSPGILSTVLVHLNRLEELDLNIKNNLKSTLAKSIQSCVHLLAIGGYGLPIQTCCLSGESLNPPLGKWEWRCSMLPNEGFVIGSIDYAAIQLNPSELALLQRLLRPHLPRKKKSGQILGPLTVWLKLLKLLEVWLNANLKKNVNSFGILRNSYLNNNSLGME